MVDLRPWRVPVAVILLAAVAVRLGAAVAGAIDAAVRGASLPSALVGLGAGPGDAVLAVALAAVCWSCAADDVRGARGFATVGFVLVGLQVLLALAGAIAALVLDRGTAPGVVQLLEQLSWLVVPVLAAAVLLRSARTRSPVVEAASGDERTALAGDEQVHDAELAETDEPPEQPYREAAGWEPDQASGAAWRTAGEAAKGGSASGWGSDEASAWEPADWPAQGPPPTDGSADR
jgi:hypothetical protein